jgi:cell division protein FtsW (lipid II flippase)
MTLPFISYGGSSIIAMAINMGIIISFTRKKVNLYKYRLLNDLQIQN